MRPITKSILIQPLGNASPFYFNGRSTEKFVGRSPNETNGSMVFGFRIKRVVADVFTGQKQM
jgi:hypothetical protein